MRFHSNLRRFECPFLNADLGDPIHYHVIQPETVRRAPDEAQVAAVLGRQQPDPRIGARSASDS